MKGNDRYYLNDPNYYKSLNFAGINNHLKGLSNSRKIVLSDIYHHCIKKNKNKKTKKNKNGSLTVVQPTSWDWISKKTILLAFDMLIPFTP